MKIGCYIVSSADQNPERQEVIMKKLGVDKVFIDKLSGKNIVTRTRTLHSLIYAWVTVGRREHLKTGAA